MMRTDYREAASRARKGAGVRWQAAGEEKLRFEILNLRLGI
jgi:hypothetical protein